MAKLNYKKIFKYIIVLIWMIVIFKFSADPAEISDGKSGKVISILNSIGISVSGMFGELANFIVRKIGHISEYFILCFLIILAIKDSFNFNKTIKFSLLSTFIYACSDEIHQLFVPGRSGRFIDVVIDMIGGFLCITIIWIYNKISNCER